MKLLWILVIYDLILFPFGIPRMILKFILVLMERLSEVNHHLKPNLRNSKRCRKRKMYLPSIRRHEQCKDDDKNDFDSDHEMMNNCDDALESEHCNSDIDDNKSEVSYSCDENKES